MKIVVIQPRISYFVGGSEKVAIRHIEYLHKICGVEIEVFTVKPVNGKYSDAYKKFFDNYKNEIIFNEIDIPFRYKYIYDWLPGSSQTRWDSESLLFSNIIFDKLNCNKYDLILNYYFVDILFKPLTIPNVVYLGGSPKQEIYIYNSFLQFCDGTLSNSSNVYTKWREKLEKEGVKYNFVIKKGVDELKVDKLTNHYKTSDFNIVFVGRLIKRKGVHILLEVIKAFSSNKDNVKLWIVGDGPEYQNLVESSKVCKEKIEFVGTTIDVYSYLYYSDLCVFPSLEGEGLMTTVCEALMCGKYVITTTGNGNEEVIKDNINGFLVEPGNVTQLSQRIEYIYQNRNSINSISTEAKNFADHNFKWTEVAKDLHAKLSKIIDGYKYLK